MTVLSRRAIRDLITKVDMVHLPRASGLDSLVGDTAFARQIQMCSFDVTLAHVGDPDSGRRITGDDWSEVTMTAGGFMLGHTYERFVMPENVVGLVVGKSSVARAGMQVECAGLVDPGFRGEVVLELSNLRPGPSLVLRPRMRIAQVMFMWLDEPVEFGHLYGGALADSHYQNQIGIRRSHLLEQ